MQLSADSPAKINLTLAVRGRRSDGFHEIESLVALIDLCDRVTLSDAPAGQWSLSCGDPVVPTDDRNLALRAARLLAERAGINAGVHIDLNKRIPAGSGLGGGSSNAAATLALGERLWRFKWPLDRLAELAAEVGSDVPLFLGGPLSIIRGRGEVVTPISLPLAGWIALVLPDVHCSTQAVYAKFDDLPSPPSRPTTEAILAELPHQPAGKNDRRPPSAAPRLAALMPRLFNDLEPAAMGVCPALADLAGRIRAATGADVRLTGSGAALFRLFDDRASAEAFAQAAAGAAAVRTAVVRLPPPPG
jgi:4-diphosphocytidyl-2-C-methyl-D-erythritol kinase